MSSPTGPGDGLPPAEDVRAGGLTLRVRRVGSGPRLLLLHGGPGLDHHVLLPLVPPLARRFEVWLPDLPGHGASAPDGEPLPGLRRLYDDLARWVRHLAGGVDFLGGHSLGAWLARELVRRGALRPRAVVLLSPPASVDGGREAFSLLAQTGPGEPLEVRGAFLEELEQEAGDSPCDEFLQALEQARLRRPTAYRALLEELVPRLRKPPAPCRPGCPVLVLGGTRDTTCPPVALAAVVSATEGARLRLLRDVGHMPWALGDSGVALEVLRFLEELSPPGAG